MFSPLCPTQSPQSEIFLPLESLLVFGCFGRKLVTTLWLCKGKLSDPLIVVVGEQMLWRVGHLYATSWSSLMCF